MTFNEETNNETNQEEVINEEEATVEEITERGYQLDTVMKIWKMLDRSEYKRRQAPPGVKIGHKAFGRDRRYPITNAFETAYRPKQGL